MAVNKKKYNDTLLLRSPCHGTDRVAIIVKGTVIMFAERQYWQDVADRFVKENVTVKPNRGNILSSDGKLMASFPYRSTVFTWTSKRGGEKKDTMLMNHPGRNLRRIAPDIPR